MIWEEAIKFLKEEKTFLLVTHINPDIDGIASMLTLCLLFENMKKIGYPLVEEIPDNVEFLPSSQKLILVENFKNKTPKACIVVDAYCPSRLSEKVLQKISGCEKFLIIDHHVLNHRKQFSKKEILLIDPSYASTTLIIFQLLKNGNFPITDKMAENLLAGVYYDTGGFKYENINANTFFLSGELVKAGANPRKISQALFENISLIQIEFLKIVLNRLVFLKDGKIAISYLTCEDFKKIGNPKSLSDLVNFLKSIKNVEISVLIKEIEKNLISVSLRSKAPIEIIELARRFGGGGHKYACGFRLKIEDLKGFIENFKDLISKYYEEQKSN